MKLFFVLVLSFFGSSFLSPQTTIQVGNVTAKIGDSLTVPIIVKDFNNIGAISIKIQFNDSVLSWGRTLNWNPQTSDGLAGLINNEIALAWDDISAANIENGKLVELIFLYKGGVSDIIFKEEECEIADINGNVIPVIYLNGQVSSVTSLNENITNIKGYFLSQNYPNPFNPVSEIEYTIPFQSRVLIEIFNLLGKRIQVLVDDFQQPGNYRTAWEADDFVGGVYFYKISATSAVSRFSEVKKMILLK